jgi:hypothetical protein
MFRWPAVAINAIGRWQLPARVGRDRSFVIVLVLWGVWHARRTFARLEESLAAAVSAA